MLSYDNGFNYSECLDEILEYSDNEQNYVLNFDINDDAENVIDKISSGFFLFLADDDVILPKTFQISFINRNETMPIDFIASRTFSNLLKTIPINDFLNL